MILHMGGQLASYKDVCDVATPTAQGTYHPIPHRTLIDVVTEQLEASGITVKARTHALNHNGNHYFGMLQLGGDGEKDYDTIVGLRNGHAWTSSSGKPAGHLSAGFVMGSQVGVCDNLMFSGEVKITRRHSRNILRDLPALVASGIGKLSQARIEQDTRLSFYKEVEIDSTQAHDFLVRGAVDQKLFAASKIPKILKEFRTPSHDEFLTEDGGRTAWTLMNAVTEIQKGMNVFNMPIKQARLVGMLDSLVGRPDRADWEFEAVPA